jgi:hypothetical protein
VTDSTVIAPDKIADFSSVEMDKIDLSAIDANTAIAGNQAFSYIGAAAFSGAAGELHFAGGFVEGDINGDTIADFKISVGVPALAAGDFVL